MAKFGINDILNAKTKAAGQQAQGYKEIYLSPYEVKAAEENTHQKLEHYVMLGQLRGIVSGLPQQRASCKKRACKTICVYG